MRVEDLNLVGSIREDRIDREVKDIKMAESIRLNVRFDVGEGENLSDWVMPLSIGTIGTGTILR